ncbi:hypothetical protein ASPFODRAFT_167703 [Aspergillus luchuensis CBS 106.47]|uniref:Uncharacterized protein n=1 Tax=Aspergillus luchuensis (strain CBS 106.47) TaxID=1137211 RepID=A0A1M3TB90_ASPLC|nr:hypothetical protein ASPFODRAFT_167703 [Aspergillus luchuensis CBS 106.47]
MSVWSLPGSVVVLSVVFPRPSSLPFLFRKPILLFAWVPDPPLLSLYTQDSTVTSSLLPPLFGSHPILNPEQASLLDYKVPS